MSPLVRAAVPDDVPEILALIRELAVYEREPDAVKTSEAQLRTHLFAERPAVYALVVPAPDGSGRRLDGIAIWFLTFSTWEGTHGIHLEDLVVHPETRGRGVGGALLAALAAIAVARGYQRVEWSVLTWNEPAIAVYRSIGAKPLDEWLGYRLDGPALTALAERASAAPEPA